MFVAASGARCAVAGHGGAQVTRLLRVTGWTLLAGGLCVLLYVVYLLWFTGFETSREQRTLANEWQSMVGASAAGEPTVDGDAPITGEPSRSGSGSARDGADPAAGLVTLAADLRAALWFERDGGGVVTDEVVYVVGDVTPAALRRGPGHYPESDEPGGPGNVAIAGHRTTYGSPFWALDELGPGDTVHLTDRSGRTWVYAFHSSAIVAPTDTWVIGPDPLGTGEPTLTLTTCHPRFSSAQRLIVWAELVGEA